MKRWIIVCFLPVLLWLAGCSDESEYGPEGGERINELTLNVALPMPFEPGTYAASAGQENQIDHIDVLGFDSTTKRFLFHTEGTDLKDAPGSVNGNAKSFRVLIPNGSYTSVFLVVIGNAHNEIATAMQTGKITATMTRDQVSAQLLLTDYSTLAGSNGKWTVNPEPFRPFPMWGETGGIDLTSASLAIPTLSMLRSLARADVLINNGAGLTNFVMKEVYLGNSMKSVRLIPLSTNVDPSLSLVKDATVSGTLTNVYAPIKYDTPSASGENKAFRSTIFIPEHVKGTSTTPARNACLIIAGYYNNSSTLSYYRIDFTKTNRNAAGDVINSEYLPVLRNHKYEVNITGVKGVGATSVTEAMAGTGVNVAVDVVCKSDDIVNIVYDGQYMLGIDRKSDDFYVHNKGTSHSVAVSTTYPAGWKATTTDTWITLGNSSQNAAGQSNLTFTIDAKSTTASRTGNILIQAGGLTKRLTVTQNLIDYVEIYSKLDTLFYPMNGKTYSFQVKSGHNWSVKIKDDQYNILKNFTPSGAANTGSGTIFNFSLVDDVADQLLVDKTTRLTFYSPTGDFDEVDVPIRGLSISGDIYYWGGLMVWPTDQPTGSTWYIYANVADGSNTNIEPPYSGVQITPPRTNSCASLPGVWRLPNLSELASIETTARRGGAVTRYGFTHNAYYWSATTYASNVTYAMLVYFGYGSQPSNNKTSTGSRARCVRSK